MVVDLYRKTMNDPYEAYKVYNALKLHFESDYDAIKYNFKTTVKPTSFYKRKDKYFFAKIAKHHGDHLIDYYVANFKAGVGYAGDMVNESGEKNYIEYKKIKESMHRVFQIDINKLSDNDFEKLLTSEDGQHPLIIKLWMQEEISLETVVILNSILGFITRESRKIKDTIIWPDQKRLIEKYTPFVKFDMDKCKNLCMKAFTNT